MEAIRTIKTFLYGVAKASAIIAFILASATKQFEPGSFAAGKRMGAGMMETMGQRYKLFRSYGHSRVIAVMLAPHTLHLFFVSGLIGFVVGSVVL